ncbi:MAG TPA: lamin tail domain-containing protein, partial [bacterium]|nr:lamin tail domain-containing protein [bacterium]
IEETSLKAKEISVEKETPLTPCSLPKNLSPTYFPVIFNEIAWAGTQKSSADEWIELRNVSAREIGLDNFQLIGRKLNSEKLSIFVVLKGKIAPRGYFLLERSDDNSVPEIEADQVFKGALNNSNFELYLFDDKCQLIDFVSASKNWPAGDRKEKRSMEREIDLDWHTYSGSGIRLGSLVIFGTPKAKNSKAKEISFSGGGGASQIVLAVGGGKKEKSKEKTSQISFCEIPSSLNPTHQVIFSEIAWAGALDHASDEWIELFNFSQKEINLRDWQILGVNLKNNQTKIKFVFEKDLKIKPKDFVLLERTDDESVPQIPADGIFTGSINNSDFALYLFDPQCQLSDFVLASSSWPAGGGEEKRSMERDENLNWHSYFGPAQTFGSKVIFGTPKTENSTSGESQTTQEERSQEESEANQEAAQSESSEPSQQENQENSEHSQILKNLRILSYLKISEVLVKSTSSLANNFQFVEIYNSTSTPIDLKDVSLQYLGSRGKKIQRISRKNLGVIPPHGFYLIASTSTVFGKKADSTFLSGKKLSTLSSGGTIFLVATTTDLNFSINSPFILDKLAYGNGNIYPEGEPIPFIKEAVSWERKAYSTSTQENYPQWQFAGNSYDSDNNLADFIFQEKPNPQNSTDLPEQEKSFFYLHQKKLNMNFLFQA